MSLERQSRCCAKECEIWVLIWARVSNLAGVEQANLESMITWFLSRLHVGERPAARLQSRPRAVAR